MKVSDMQKMVGSGTQFVMVTKEEVLANTSELRALMQKLRVAQVEARNEY
jgi:hypothetical protein